MNNARTALFWGGCLCGLLWNTLPVCAQTFSSGSTGSLGAFAPVSNTVVTLPADGILNYTTVTIPTGVTVSFQPNAANTPVTMLATGDVTISGILYLDGAVGTGFTTSGPAVYAGGRGGPGGFSGGQSGARGNSNNDASDGQGPGGGAATSGPSGSVSGTYGAPAPFVSLLPLFGGSGGGGFKGSVTHAGVSGGGGGGAIVIASSTKITLNGTMVARGGGRGPSGAELAGAGSGGAMRLVAPEIAGAGVLYVNGGAVGAGDGRVRLEAFRMNFTGTVQPSSQYLSISTMCGPVTSSSLPALVEPRLRISSIAGVATPSTTGGTYSTADLTLPPGTTNPVTVEVTGTNIPVGSTFKLKHIPQFAAAATPLTATSTGTLATSTATFSVTLPVAQVSILNAWSDFTLP